MSVTIMTCSTNHLLSKTQLIQLTELLLTHTNQSNVKQPNPKIRFFFENQTNTKQESHAVTGKPFDAAVNFNQYRVCRYRQLVLVAVDVAAKTEYNNLTSFMKVCHKKKLESLLEVIQNFGTNLYLVYDFIQAVNSNFRPIIAHFRDIACFVLWKATVYEPQYPLPFHLKFGDVPLRLQYIDNVTGYQEWGPWPNYMCNCFWTNTSYMTTISQLTDDAHTGRWLAMVVPHCAYHCMVKTIPHSTRKNHLRTLCQ